MGNEIIALVSLPVCMYGISNFIICAPLSTYLVHGDMKQSTFSCTKGQLFYAAGAY